MSKRHFAKSLRAFALTVMLLLAAASTTAIRAQSGVQGSSDVSAGNFVQATTLKAVATQGGSKASAVKIRPSAVDVLVFDSFTGADSYTTTTGSPRTFMGYAFNAADPGVPLQITKLTVYIAYTGTTATTYNSLRVNFQLWNDFASASSPVFSNGVSGGPFFADLAGPITLNPNTYSPVDITLGSPVPMTDLVNNGYAVNIQGDTGSGLASNDFLTSLLRYGANPIAVGSSPIPGTSYGYRNASGLTNFNFNSSDLRGFASVSNQATVFKLYASGSSGPTATPTSTSTPTNTPVVSNTPTNTPTATATTPASTLVQDGGFEAGIVPTYWTQTSTNFGTPLCDASCGGVGPRTGTYWAWFGGAGTAAEAATLEQTGIITSGPKTLTFYVWWSSSVASPPDPAAFFNVKIDGNTIFSLTPATASAYSTAYTLASVDISAYADGNNHLLRFESNNAASSGSTNIHLDDINIISGGGPTNTPTATATTGATSTSTNTPTATNTAVPPQPDTIGVYNGGLFYLRNTNNTGGADINVAFGGDVSDLPVAGDWNGDGVDTIGVYRNSTGFYFLSDSNTSPAVNYTVLFGNPGDTPFAGKWTADMTHDGLGVYRNSNGILYQKKDLTTGFDDFFAIFGNPGDAGFAGDWDDNGFDSIGVYRSSNTTWYMTNNSSPSGITFSDYDFVLDTSGALTVAGDWDGDGDSTPGWLTSGGVFSLHPNNSIVGPDNVFAFGPANSLPIAGKWVASAKPATGNVLAAGSASRANPNQGGSGD